MKKKLLIALFTCFPLFLYGQINGPTYDNGVIRVSESNDENVKLGKSGQVSYSLNDANIFNVAEKGDFNKYFPDGAMPPNIILNGKQDDYKSIALVYQEVMINDNIYGFVFHYLYSETIDDLSIAYDSDLDNDYATKTKELTFNKDVYRFTLDYSINEEEFQIEFKNPLRDPAIFVEEYFLEGLELSFLSDVEFGLGGFGNESYTLQYLDADVASKFNYKYEYRTGHFAFSPSLVYKNLGININAVYEIRQPRNGLETVYYNNELIRTDNGVANIFPKARLIINYGAFYQFLISNVLVVRPYINYGNFYFTGFASEEFNNFRIKKNIVTYGSKFIFPTSNKSGFYLNLSFSKDIYEAVQDIKVRDGNTYPHTLGSNYVANQLNISFGYSIKVF